jgi:8-oxo-dGTP pyrophosphatase MutT (NUDIX family)
VTPTDGTDAWATLAEAEVVRRLQTHAPLRGNGHGAAAQRRGDDDLNPGFLATLESFKPAAVLVPLLRRPSGLSILLTRRTTSLPDHAGQICFPGGRIAAQDPSASGAALREAEEEVGLAPTGIALTAELDAYHTRTGYAVTPLVGVVDAPEAFRPDPCEVAEVFEVPLPFVVDPANRETHSLTVRGTARHYHVFVYGPHYIWGATAGMLVNLAEVLRRPC